MVCENYKSWSIKEIMFWYKQKYQSGALKENLSRVCFTLLQQICEIPGKYLPRSHSTYKKNCRPKNALLLKPTPLRSSWDLSKIFLLQWTKVWWHFLKKPLVGNFIFKQWTACTLSLLIFLKESVLNFLFFSSFIMV